MKKQQSLIALAAFGLSMFFPFRLRAEDPDQWFREAEKEYREFAEEANDSYRSFQDRVNKEYAAFMAQPWTPVNTFEPITPPTLPEPGPILVDEGDPCLADEPVEIEISEIIPSVSPVSPPPEPHEPVSPQPCLTDGDCIKVLFYGTINDVPSIDLTGFRIPSFNSTGFAHGWKQLSTLNCNVLINGCLNIRDALKLPDWYYILFLDAVAARLTPRDSNEHVMLLGYLLNQSGYDMRFVSERSSGKLHLVFRTSGTFYNRARYQLGNGWYYAYTDPKGAVTVCDFSTPGERPMSVDILQLPRLPFKPGKTRTIEVHDHPELVLNVTTNQNLIDFFGDYPSTALSTTEDSRWMVQVKVPTSNEIKEQVYPRLREALKGKTQYEAVNLLLRVAQSFPYEYDEKLWGGDRIFFMEESWHYPYSDCEDHAINFSHMVRDLLGLETALICYPEHLSAAVALTDGTEKGDYLLYNGKKYMVCDATYFYAPAGSTAPALRNVKGRLIPIL